MFCIYCGKQIPDDAVICVGCGKIVEQNKHLLKKSDSPQGGAGLAITSMVISIITLVITIYAPAVNGIILYKADAIGILFLSMVSVILGSISLGLRRQGKGIAITGIIIGGLCMCVSMGSLF